MQFLKEPLTEKQANLMNPVVLAFVGDAVYTLYVRSRAAVRGDKKADQLNKESAAVVSAVAQAKKADAIFAALTETEQAVFRRARNTKKNTRAKNASVAEYHKSTGLEAVFGYLYLTGNSERLFALLAMNTEEEHEG